MQVVDRWDGEGWADHGPAFDADFGDEGLQECLAGRRVAVSDDVADLEDRAGVLEQLLCDQGLVRAGTTMFAAFADAARFPPVAATT